MVAEWFWAGAVTTTSATMVAKVDSGTPTVTLVASLLSNMTSEIVSTGAVADANGYAKCTLTGLTPDTLYYYLPALDGDHAALSPGRFRTFPTTSEPGFMFAFGSCSFTDSDHEVWEAITARGPRFFAHLGDFHYENIATNDQDLFRAAIEECMAQPNRIETHRNMPNVYVWDDHDYGPDNSDSTSAARPAASAVYRQTVPHYPLPAGSGDNPIYQTFDYGRVRFIATDLRHARSPNSDTDNSSKTMLGATQKTWFKALLDQSASDGTGLIVWLSAAVWCANTTAGADHWGGFNTERVELANYIRDSRCPPVLLLGGDTHSACFDDGRRGDYATGGGGPVMSFHAGALDQSGLTVGQDWMSGSDEGGGRYGVVRLVDDGEQLTVHLSAINVSGATQTRIKSFLFLADPTRRNARIRALT